ncbi:MAG: serine/threonine protein kinase, partial [Candidatus Latescibacterota bacterium]
MIGQTVSHYNIVEKLGEGGMGVVYKAHDTKLKRTVALKFLSRHLLTDEQQRKRFIHEAQAAAGLTHPHICTVHEIHEADGHTFMVMEYIEGESLRHKIESSTLDVIDALDVAIQVSKGLSKAHEQGIIHRDIKPGNVLMTPEGDA